MLRRGVDPEGAVDLALGVDDAVRESAEDLLPRARVLQDGLTFGLEAGEQMIAGGKPLTDEGLCDRIGLMHVRNVPDDAEEVSGVGTFWEGAGVLLAVEGGDAVGDRRPTVKRNGGLEVIVRIGQAEVLEGRIEALAYEGIDTSLSVSSSLLLSAPALLELRLCLSNLLLGR